jgi:hypothetical protein
MRKWGASITLIRMKLSLSLLPALAAADHFAAWRAEHGVAYETAEELSMRQKHFEANLKVVSSLNDDPSVRAP